MNKSFRCLSLSLTKDFILIYRLSIVGIFIVGSLFLKLSINQKKEEIVEKILLSNEQIEQSITYNIDYIKYQIYYASKQIKDGKAYLNKKEMKKILSSFVNRINAQNDISISWSSFSWIDQDNKLSVDGAAGIIPKAIDMSSRDYLQITSKIPTKLALGKTIIGSVSDLFIIPVGIGISSEDGIYFGTVVAGLDIERITSKIEKTIGDKTISFAVMMNEEIAFTSNNFAKESLLIAKDMAKELKNDSNPEKIIDSQNIFNKDQSFIYFKAIENSPLKVIVFYDKDKSYQQILNIFLKQFIFIILIISVSAILFQRIYKNIVKTMSDLSNFALKISEKDFSFAPEKPAKKELINLYNTLNLVKNSFQREQTLLSQLGDANLQLKQANQSKDNLLYSITHDIKNYAFGINGLAQMILDEEAQASDKNQSLTQNQSKSFSFLSDQNLQNIETIADQSEELMHFVNDLLDKEQIESGTLTLGKFQSCNLKQLINRLVLLNNSLAIKHKVKIKTNIDPDIPDLFCDIRRIKQILVNLTTNAIKYSRKGGEVFISANHLKNEHQVYLEIVDSGIGMNEEEIKKYLSGNGKEIDKSDIDGEIDSHGIGMKTVLHLLKLFNAKIEAESQKGLEQK